jgi:hypothetical protein
VIVPLLFIIVMASGCRVLRPSAPALPNAPVEVSNRQPLPHCGRESTVDNGEANVVGRRCFWDAYQAGHAAEFISTQPTVEGDPVTLVYRALGNGLVEIFVDITYDMSGSNPPPRWIRLDCRTLALIDGAPDQPALGPGDCDESALS